MAASAQTLNSFGVLAGSTVTNTGSSVINGNIGIAPGTAITGFPPGIVNAPYTIHDDDAVALQAQSELTTAYNVLMSMPSTSLSGDLGGKTLIGGVYSFATSAQLTGTLTLQGSASDIFVIQVGTSLTTASNAKVVLTGGAVASNVFFVVGSSATLGTTTDFAGQILALASITMTTGADIDCGAAWARNGAVTLDTNSINVCTLAVAPGTFTTGLGPTATDDEKTVAAALDAYVAGGGTLPVGFGVLSLLTPAQQAAALAQLSGETATGVAPTGTQATDSFLNLVLNGRRGAGVVVLPGQTMTPEPGGVSVLDYGPREPATASSAFAAFDRPPVSYNNDPRVNGWVAALGDYSRVSGDAAVGSHDRTSRNLALAAGIDYHLSPDAKVGFAVAGGVTDFELAGGFGSGHSWMAEVAAYGEKDLGNAYVSGAIAYGFHNEQTTRRVTVAGLDTLTAQFNAQDLAGQLEAGYRMGVLTPFVGVRGHAFTIPGYTEAASGGNSTFALAYDGQTVTTARTEVGARLDWTTPLEHGGTIGLHARAAWAHDFWWNDRINLSFVDLPGSGFSVQGASAGADSALISAGADLNLASGMTLGASVNGGFATNAQTYGGSLKIGYSW
jgi:uncharacterized protein with beta-barrel porin domain